jgi:hypothetical protein
MNSYPQQTPEDELQAGYALSDLSEQEWDLWYVRANDQGIKPDAQLEWITLQLEIEAAMNEPEIISASLVATLKEQARNRSQTHESIVPLQSKVQTRRGHSPWWGWSVAACLAVLLVLQSQQQTPDSKAVPLELSKTIFVQEAPDLLRLPLAGTTGLYAQTQGEVLWSDEKQEGYLVLSDLPANDRERYQYQLWIVDPLRDEIPVDGGVFDVSSSGDASVVIPIEAKLNIRQPQAFVITVEQVGGVVKSKQETVVGVAKK